MVSSSRNLKAKSLLDASDWLQFLTMKSLSPNQIQIDFSATEFSGLMIKILESFQKVKSKHNKQVSITIHSVPFLEFGNFPKSWINI